VRRGLDSASAFDQREIDVLIVIAQLGMETGRRADDAWRECPAHAATRIEDCVFSLDVAAGIILIIHHIDFRPI
jgi:hypothetical protein